MDSKNRLMSPNLVVAFSFLNETQQCSSKDPPISKTMDISANLIEDDCPLAQDDCELGNSYSG